MLTIIARETTKLLSRSVWDWYEDFILKDTEYEVIDIESNQPIRGNRILLMGQPAVNQFLAPELNIFKIRGTLYAYDKRPCMATFDLQDAYDFKPIKEDEIDRTFAKDRAKTQQSNWLFWIKSDTRKLLGELGGPSIPKVQYAPDLVAYTRYLSAVKGQTIYLDIETDIQSDTLDCIGLHVEGGKYVVVVPIYNYEGNLSYDRQLILRFLAALSTALLHNRVVIHNAMFDLLYLASHYRLPFGRDIFDTMLAHKRAFPEVEKSLGHAISYWTWQPYHKDEHTVARSKEGMQQLWEYNAKDVWSMRLVYLAQQRELARNLQLKASVDQANRSIYPYLLASLKGLSINISTLTAAKVALDRQIKQIKRIIHALIGDSSFNPDSPKQLVKYFHDKLNYKVMGYTKTGSPSLGSDELYELALKYDNPLIQTILYYRAKAKERGMMNFCNLIYKWQSL